VKSSWLALLSNTAGSNNDNAKQDRKPAAIKSGKETWSKNQKSGTPLIHWKNFLLGTFH
jgi:hypothetical protein